MNYRKLWEELKEVLDSSEFEIWYFWQVTDLMNDMETVQKMEEGVPEE